MITSIPKANLMSIEHDPDAAPDRLFEIVKY